MSCWMGMDSPSTIPGKWGCLGFVAILTFLFPLLFLFFSPPWDAQSWFVPRCGYTWNAARWRGVQGFALPISKFQLLSPLIPSPL